MIDRVDLLIAVIGIVVSVVGSSTALWVAVSKKTDRADLASVESRLESKIDSGLTRLDLKIDRVEAKLDSGLGRVEAKIDALILRLVPEQLPRPEN